MRRVSGGRILRGCEGSGAGVEDGVCGLGMGGGISEWAVR
jgi:hypothetical protein